MSDRGSPPGGNRSGADSAQTDEPSAGQSAAPSGQVFYCDLCGNAMLNLHCKLICERCGYKRDCSDP